MSATRPDSDATRPDVARYQSVEDGGGGAGTRPCTQWVVWEEWQTAEDERTCPQCRPLDGAWWRQGDGPQPPLHVNCRCRREVVWWECVSRAAPSDAERPNPSGGKQLR